MKPSRTALGYLLGLVGVLIFSGTLPATRLAVETLNPWFVTFGRAAIAGVCAGVLLLVLRRPVPSRVVLRSLLLIGVMVTIGFPGFMGLAMARVPASHGGVVLGIMPLLTAMLSALWHGERPSRRFWLLALLGAGVVVGFSLRTGGGHLQAGDLFLFVAAISAAVGYVLSAQLTRSMPGWEVISWVCLVMLPVTVPLSLLWWPADLAAVTSTGWVSLAYLALFSQFIGFFAWNAGLAMGGVAGVSQIQLLQTFFTIAIAALINAEAIGWDTMGVAVLIVGMLYLGRRG